MVQSELSRRPGGDHASGAEAAVLVELLDLCAAPAAALWIRTAGDVLELAETAGLWPDRRDGPDEPSAAPARFADVAAAAAWAEAAGWAGAPIGPAERGSEDVWPGDGFVAVALTAVGPRAASEDGSSPGSAGFVGRALTAAARLARIRADLERERSMLSIVFENASDAIVAVDAECRIVRHNPAAVALLGRADGRPGGLTCAEYLGCDASDDGAPGDEVTGGDAGPGGDGGHGAAQGAAAGAPEPSSGAEPSRLSRCDPPCPFEQVLYGPTAVVSRDQTFIGPRDARIPVAATYVRTAGPDLGAVAVFRDLRAAHAIDELKSSFVAAVSHELRTPLALISGYTQSLLELELDEASRRRFVERIDGTANRLRGLVDQLLDVATLESDRLAVDPRRVNLRGLIKSIIDEVAEMPGSLPVSLSVPPDLPLVYADPIRIGQVVANLLDNARKYGARGSMVTIRVRRSGDQAVVTVDNDGPEIDPEERENVFERFYRGRDARASGTPGIGLGLHLCRRLVEAHGGQIRLEERTGGTAVSLTLPLALDAWARRGEEAALSGERQEPRRPGAGQAGAKP